MGPDGFKPLTGVLRSKVADGKVGYHRPQSPVSDFKSPVLRRGALGTQVCIGWIHRCVLSWCTGVTPENDKRGTSASYVV